MLDTEFNTDNSHIPLSEIFDKHSKNNHDGTRSIALKELRGSHLKESFDGLTGKDVVIAQENTDGETKLTPTKIVRVEQVGDESIEIYHVGPDGQEWIIPLNSREKGVTIRKASQTREVLEIGVVYNLDKKTPVVGSDIKYATYTVVKGP